VSIVDVEGRTVVVTGASSGIGEATAKAFAAKGGHVVMLARRQELLESLASEIAGNGGEARPWPVDLGDSEATTKAAGEIEAELGVPDVLVNCAGAGSGYFLEEMPPEEIERSMAVPFFAAANMTRAFLPGMLERRSGYIVNVGSPIAYATWPGAAGYACARWAMRGLSEVLTQELRGTGVRAASVVPGHVDSPYFKANPGLRESIPGIATLAGKVSPERVASAIVGAVERERRQVYVPFMMGVLIFQSRIFPRLTQYVVAKTGARRAPAGERSAEA
jgi:short-subunit dehydrogenase